MSDGPMERPDGDDLDLLADLLDRAQLLPVGPERTAALQEIRSFQKRLAAMMAANSRLARND